MDEYTDALIEERNKLFDMLKRTLVFVDATLLDRPGYKMPADIQKWWDENRNET